MKLIIKKKQLAAIVILCYNFQYRKLVTTYCIYNGLLILDVMVEQPSKNGVSFNFAGTNGYITDLNLEKADNEFSTDSDPLMYEMIQNETPFQFDIHVADYTELAGSYINTKYQGNSAIPNGMSVIEFEQYLMDSETVYPVQITNFDCMEHQ